MIVSRGVRCFSQSQVRVVVPQINGSVVVLLLFCGCPALIDFSLLFKVLISFHYCTFE